MKYSMQPTDAGMSLTEDITTPTPAPATAGSHIATTKKQRKPRVAALSLDKHPSFDEDIPDTLQAIKSRATFQRLTQPKSIIRALALGEDNSPNRPDCVLLADGALATNPVKYRKVIEALAAFVREGGGTAVCTYKFPSETPMAAMDAFFATAMGVRWTHGSFLRTTHHLNRSSHFYISETGAAALARLSGGSTTEGYTNNAGCHLPESFSVKALTLKNVPPAEALYLPHPTGSVVESMESRFGGRPFELVGDVTQTPCALAAVGRGRFGYVSDWNQEGGVVKTLVAVLGLPHGSTELDKELPAAHPNKDLGFTAGPSDVFFASAEAVAAGTSSVRYTVQSGDPPGLVPVVPGPHNTVPAGTTCRYGRPTGEPVNMERERAQREFQKRTYADLIEGRIPKGPKMASGRVLMIADHSTNW